MMLRRLMAGAGLVLALSGCSVDIPADASGEEIYRVLCTRCHAADLSGSVGPALGAGSSLVDRPDAYLTQTITVGLGRMPSFRSTLTPEQTERVVEYLRQVQAGG